MKSDRIVTVVSVIMIAMILTGAVAVYGMGSGRYSSDASLENDIIDYSISAAGSKDYSILITQTDMERMDEIYIYFDGTYSNVTEESEAIGPSPEDQWNSIDQFVKMLEFRNVRNVTMMDAEELGERMDSDVSSSNAATRGLVIMSGTLPDTIYNDRSNTIFEWLNAGGRLYWTGGLIGKYCSTAEKATEVPGYQSKFFDDLPLNDGKADGATSAIDNQYRDALSLQNNYVKFGVNISDFHADEALEMGYREDGYASIALMKYGGGMVCVVGGNYSMDLISDLAQVVASNICYSSKIIEIKKGIVNNTVRSSIDVSKADEYPNSELLHVYICIGGHFPVYGKLYSYS